MVRLKVHVTPGASRDRVALGGDGSLSVWLRARAVEGRANSALVAFLAQTLGVPRSQVLLVRGQRTRTKTVDLPVASLEELRARLGSTS